jgi:hypothetical protein
MSFNEQWLGDSNFWESLEEYDSMQDAFDDLGADKPFLASQTNTEGWPWRALLVTVEPEES